MTATAPFSPVAGRCLKRGPGLLLALVVTATVARADVKYTQVSSAPHGADGKLAPMGTTITLIKAGAQRVEATQNLGPFQMQDITITTCADKQRVRLDPTLKIYTAESIEHKTHASTDGSPATGRQKPSATTKKTGKVVNTFTVNFIDNAKIAERVTRHYMITQRFQISGCGDAVDSTFKREVWMADVEIPVFDCGDSNNDWHSYVGDKSDGCEMTYEQKGDVAALTAANKGLALKTITYNPKNDKVMMSQEITMLSFAKLDDTDFTVPADYKKVTAKEYDQARQKAMMKAMMSGMGAGAKDGDGDESDVTDKGEDGSEQSANDSQETPDADDDNDSGDNTEDNDALEQAAKEAAKNKVRGKFHFPF